MYKMSSFLNLIDIFGEKVKVYINNRETVTSSLGGTLTIIMLGLVIAASWLIGKDIVYKRNPSTYQESLILRNYPKLNLSYNNFPIAFAVYDYYSLPVKNDTLFKMEVVLNEVTQVNNETYYNSTILDLIPCEHRHFPHLTEEDYSKSSIPNFMCLKDDNITLEGYWSESFFRFIQVALKKCVNQPDCSNENEIQSYIRRTGINLNILYLTPFLEETDYLKPISHSLTVKYTFALSTQSKLIGYGLEKDYLITDAGFIVEDKNKTEFYNINEVKTLDTLDINESTGELIVFEFYSANKYNNYFRKYIKVPEILASVGGLINVSIILFGFINLPFSRNNKNTYAINNLLDFDSLKSNSQSKPMFNTLKELNNSKIIQVDPGNTNLPQPSNNKSSIPNTYIQTAEKIKTLFKNRKKLDFNYTEKFKMLLCSRFSKRFPNALAERFSKYSIGVTFIHSYFDLVKIIRKLLEFDLFKKVMLSKDQNELFEILNKIKSNDCINNEYLVSTEGYVKDLYEKEDKSNVDLNLIKLLNF
jgi:hypothetical protein